MPNESKHSTVKSKNQPATKKRARKKSRGKEYNPFAIAEKGIGKTCKPERTMNTYDTPSETDFAARAEAKEERSIARAEAKKECDHSAAYQIEEIFNTYHCPDCDKTLIQKA